MLNYKCFSPAKWLQSPLFWIVCLATFFRLYQLNSIPPGFFRDEAAKGYNAYCLLKTGKDIDNHFLPIFTREFTVYNSALSTYLIVPSIYLFGLTEFATRLPFALVGILTVLVTYGLVSTMYSRRTGYLASFLLAISPWHLLFSRWANQGILLPLLTVLALFCWIKATQSAKERRNGRMVISLLLFALSFYTYDIAKVFIPLFLVGLFVTYRNEIKQNKIRFLIGLICFLFLLIPIIWFSFEANVISQARFHRISIFTLDLTIWQTCKLFIINYLAHLSPQFLFFSGDSNLRHNLLGMGEIYLFELPFLIIGLFILITQKNKLNKVLLWWLLIFPIAASLTDEGIPHALRTICALPVISIISAIGLDKCLSASERLTAKTTSSIILRIIIISFVFINIFYFMFSYFYLYPTYSPPAWQYGWKSAVAYLDSVKVKYSEIIVSQSFGYPHIFILFYDRIPPHLWQNHEWNIPPFRFNIPDNYIIDEMQYAAGNTTLFVLPFSRYISIPIRKSIDYPDGQAAIVFLGK